ncbi:aprataxin-like protein [Wyeomyia smithii]|uniref:aprataxin-like protein n=1 Tax=Wyeomyia smithii TaxID=174621 RepID=UPI002467E00D|nr:aprataxin-like protein [Wyeomyia smithii]
MADWSFNLIADMKNPKLVLFRSDLAAVIRDKYPKSNHHFLVLPWENINTVYQLSLKHVTLLRDMYDLAMKSIQNTRVKLEYFKIGFHMRPSMNRLHLHVISKDFRGAGLKRIRHWTHFNTAFFMPYQDVLDELLEHGTIIARSTAYIEKLLSAPLLCNQCDFQTTEIEQIVRHLRNFH